MTNTDTIRASLFDPISGGSLPERAAYQVERLILNGVLRDGAKLPGERDLALQLDISRPKLREALKLLEDRGLIRIASGEGAFVMPLAGPGLSPALLELFTRHPQARDDHMEYRRHQEAFAARLAAERATPEDRKRIADIIDQMREARAAGDEVLESNLDIAFHTAILEECYYRLVIHTMSALYELTKNSIFLSRDALFADGSVGDRLLEQHVRIADAILASDAATAEAASVEHLDYVRASLETLRRLQDRERIAEKRRAL